VTRILVCGGRNFCDVAFVRAHLDRLHREVLIGVVIEGDAPGVDRIAGYWARRNRIDNLKFKADWRAHGRAAGPLRNARMIAEGRPELVVAFPGGRGTADMTARARAAGIDVREIA
jgi:hypothetical protein